MKTQSKFRRFTVAAVGILPVLAVSALNPSVYAGPPSVVKEANQAATISVTIPPNAEPATYVLGDKKWTIQPGETAVLPAAATRIYLPVGTVIRTLTPSAKSMEPTEQAYTVSQPITLPTLTPGAIRTNEQFITPGGGVSTPTGLVHLPPGTIADLVDAVFSASGTTVNPHNVLGEGVTDGN